MTDKHNGMFNRLKLGSLTALLVIAGCGTPPKHDTQRVGLDMQRFSSGNVTLSCSTTSCAWTFGSKRNLLLSLQQSSQWERLANEVLALDFDQDLSYFYLGQAAEGMGNSRAALNYYRLSLHHRIKCNGAINVCDKFVLSALIPPRIRQLEIQLAAEAERLAKTRAAAPAPLPPASKAPTYSYLVTTSGAPQGSTKYSGPNVGTSGHTLLLRGWRTANGETLYQIYVAVNYFGTKRNYTSSIDSKGATLRFTPAASDSKNCNGARCQYTEHIAITLPRSYLAENRSSGIELALKYDNGGTQVNLNAPYVQDFLAQTP
jgi:hypothetical protein